jgi:hypothetical protein
LKGRRENLSQANKLSRTYATLLEALNRHRGKGQQKVTVEHVHVHEGGQAIVGNVAGGGMRTKSERIVAETVFVTFAPSLLILCWFCFRFLASINYNRERFRERRT